MKTCTHEYPDGTMCEKPYSHNGFCNPHNRRVKKKTDMDAPFRRKHNLGDIFLNKGGYVDFCLGNGKWMPEHRYVYEQHTGRPLLKDETIHHINGQKDDNRFENLEIWDTNHPSGQRVVDKLKWARDYLELKGDLLDILLIKKYDSQKNGVCK